MSVGPVMLDLKGVELDAVEREMLLHPHAGGVILFSRNFESREQVEQLVESIHGLRHRGLLVAVDHEGGRVQRFREGFSAIPPAGVLGKRYDENRKSALHAAELFGWLLASELRAVGVDLSFAPVLDLDRGFSKVIGDRALHQRPEAVADLAHAWMRGMQQAGMAATGKHFPGHGGVEPDSHLELPVDGRAFRDIEAEDLIPFERMIHYGLPAVMVAHIVYEQVDRNAAGFSPFWLREVLRRRMEFQGVIFSDDLSMKAAAVVGDCVDRARASLDAGCDMVLVCNDPDGAAAVLEGLGDFDNPAARMRLVRMHGRRQRTTAELHEDPRWHEAVKIANDLAGSPDLDLNL